jgi:hypothetical protein
MIVSFKHNFIFLKTNKTAGTSVEIGLSKFCGPDDILPELVPEDEALRRELGYPGAQNYLVPFSYYKPRDWWLLLKKRKRRRYISHMTAKWAKRFLPDEIWNNAFKFAIERNPWDRAISLYYWKYPEEPRPSLEEFVFSDEINRLKRKGSQLYSIDGEIVVDKVYLFEDLTNAMADVAKQIGLPEVPELPRAKGKTRPKKKPYQECLSDKAREHIQSVFADEIERYGYKF